MVECNCQDYGYDPAPGEKPACNSGKRHKKLGKDSDYHGNPERCDYVGRETDCDWFDVVGRE